MTKGPPLSQPCPRSHFNRLSLQSHAPNHPREPFWRPVRPDLTPNHPPTFRLRATADKYARGLPGHPRQRASADLWREGVYAPGLSCAVRRKATAPASHSADAVRRRIALKVAAIVIGRRCVYMLAGVRVAHALHRSCAGPALLRATSARLTAAPLNGRRRRRPSPAPGAVAPFYESANALHAAGLPLTLGDCGRRHTITGPGEAAGKTMFLEALRAALGEYARTIQADLLTRQRESRGGGAASPELAGLAGARLAAGSEMEQGREIAEALAKNLTGGESIAARHLYAELFDFRPQFKLWLALNHCPKVSADDGAIWRRILRIGFEHTVPPERRDKTLKPYLRDPAGGAPAVLAWAVEGCLRWQREGLQVPAAVARSTAAYRQESDPLAAFMEDCLRFTQAACTPWGDIWAAYNAHCAENGTAERYRVAAKRLQERLRSHDCQYEHRYSGRGWSGVEIQEGWQSGNHDAHDGYDATSQTFSSFSSRRKVLDKPSYPTYPTCPPAAKPAELDLAAPGSAPAEAEARDTPIPKGGTA